MQNQKGGNEGIRGTKNGDNCTLFKFRKETKEGNVMVKIKFNVKSIMTVLFVLACSALAFLWPYWNNDLRAETYRPPNPVMDYVPQYIGIYDTYYSYYVADDCRVCHGNRNAGAKRHQFTASAFANCPDGCPLSPQDCLSACHSFFPGDPESITYDCRECHIDGGIMGDLGFPHHRSDLANSGKCTACHRPDLLVETISVKSPSYYPTAYPFVPTPFTCENCHWPSGSTPHTPPPDWPKPIEAKGTVLTGVLHESKPYRPLDGTHHEVQGKVYYQCFFCHANDPDSPTWDPANPLIIRFCENCHSKDSMHSIEEHTTAGHGLTIEQKCVACHGGMPDTSPVSAPVQPVIADISPRFGPGGTSCSLSGENFGSSGEIFLTPRMGETAQTHRTSSGECTWTDGLIVFTVPSGLSNRNYNVKVKTPNGTSNMQVFTIAGTQPCIPCPTLAPVIDSIEPTLGVAQQLVTIHGQNFGDRHTGDRDVLLMQESSVSAAKIISWADNEIQSSVPEWTFYPGTVSVKVKTENGESNQVDFELRKYPHIVTIDQPETTILRFSGKGFGDSQQYVRPDGYGWQTTITLNRPNQIISTSSCTIISWSDTEIQLTSPGNLSGFYGVTVETMYFYDSDGNGSYTPGLETIYHTVTSDPYNVSLMTPITCGNNIINPCETCDPPGSTPQLPPGNQNQCLQTCTYCGDGIVNNGEQCDDGNTNNNDTCRNNCITSRCGNGILEPGEQCDDGNTNNGDGCSATCQLEAIKVHAPNGGEVILSGSTYTIRWGAPLEAVKFTLRYSINNGATWKLMAKNITGTSYNWNVPALLNNKNGCLVKVIGFNSSGTKVGEDTSDATFTIEVVKLTSPDGGEILQQGTPHTITWHTNGTIRPVANAKLFYTTNGGSTWKAIKTLTGNPGSYNWRVPNVSSSSCKVKVVLKDSSGITIGSDMSDGVFTIQP